MSGEPSLTVWVIRFATCSECNREGVCVRASEPSEEELRALEKEFGGGYCTGVAVSRCEAGGPILERRRRD